MVVKILGRIRSNTKLQLMLGSVKYNYEKYFYDMYPWRTSEFALNKGLIFTAQKLSFG